ncbi:MAG TPA: hypothetical protein DDY39_14460 [Nitrospira sp.]|nr:hypothetical protein [Nitrospira sp.]HBR50364.1 hypothetical protein [Nitrospira sp.]
MPRHIEPIKLLKQAAKSFDAQGKFLDAARAAFEYVHPEVRPGVRAKVADLQIFKAITQYVLNMLRQNEPLPTKHAVARHISKEYKISLSRAKVYFKIWKLFYITSVVNLTAADETWLKKMYGPVAKPFFLKWWLGKPESVERHSARVKAKQDLELDRLIDELKGELWKRKRPQQHSSKSRYLTRAEILKRLQT